MNNLKLAAVLVSVILLATGCSNKFNKFARNDEYQKKDTLYGKGIVVPRDLSDSAIENYYPVPRSRSSGSKNNIAVPTVPPGFQIKR